MLFAWAALAAAAAAAASTEHLDTSAAGDLAALDAAAPLDRPAPGACVRTVCSAQLLVAAPRAGHAPAAPRGCRSPAAWLELPAEARELFGPCCGVHAACASSCGASKETCDASLADCLAGLCRVERPAGTLRCRAAADAVAGAVSAFGCPAYLDAQAQGCACVDPADYDAAYYGAAMGLYEVHNPALATDAHVSSLLEAWADREGDMLAALYRTYPQAVEVR